MSTTQDTVTGIPFCPERFRHLLEKVPAVTAEKALAQILAPVLALAAARPMHPPRARDVTRRHCGAQAGLRPRPGRCTDDRLPGSARSHQVRTH